MTFRTYNFLFCWLNCCIIAFPSRAQENTADIKFLRNTDEISLTIDGTPVADWERPRSLKAGIHRFVAKWRNHKVSTSITLLEGQKRQPSYVSFQAEDGQLAVKHNFRLVDVAPRPAPQKLAIQSASAQFWRATKDNGIMLRPQENDTEFFTIHWLRPDHSEAFIQSSNGQFVGKKDVLEFGKPSLLELSETPSVFKTRRVEAHEPWIAFTVGRHFIDAGAEQDHVRLTRYEAFSCPHRLVSATDLARKVTSIPTTTTPFAISESKPDVRILKGHQDVVSALRFLPDGRHIVSGSFDGSVRLWEVQTGKQVDAVQTYAPVTSVAVSSNGKKLAAGMLDLAVKTWEIKSEREVTFSDEQILSRGTDIRPLQKFWGVNAIAFSPDDSKLVAGGIHQRHTRIWNLLAPNEEPERLGYYGPIASLVWSRSGLRVLVCVSDHRAANTSNGRQLRWLPTDAKENGAYNAHRDPRSGKVLFQAGDAPLVIVAGEVKDAETYETLHKLQRRHDLRSTSVDMSDRKKHLATGDVLINTNHESEPDELVMVWDLETGRSVARLRQRFGQVGKVAISPDGGHVAFGGGVRQVAYSAHKKTGDHVIRLWKVPVSNSIRAPVSN